MVGRAKKVLGLIHGGRLCFCKYRRAAQNGLAGRMLAVAHA